MPSQLKYYSNKPAHIDRSRWKGSGYYYNRGEGRWTKWSRARDIKRGSRSTVGVGRTKHMNDSRKKKRR